MKETEQQEDKFVRDAKAADLIDLVLKGELSPEAQVILVQRRLVEPLQIHIEEYGLCEAAAKELFQANDWGSARFLSERLLAWSFSQPEVVKAFLDYAPYEMVKEYVTQFSVKELPEQDALERFDKKELSKLIEGGNISLFAKCDILMRGNDSLVKNVIELGNLNVREALIALKHASPESLEFWAFRTDDTHLICLIYQFETIRFSSTDYLWKYIEEGQLERETEEFFFETAATDLLEAYVSKYNPAGGYVALLKRLIDERPIFSFLATHILPVEAELFLIARGYPREILAYMKAHSFSPDGEVALIERGVGKEIRSYLSLHSLSMEGQLALMKRGVKAEISLLMFRYPLANAAIEAISRNMRLNRMFGKQAYATAYSIV